MKPRQTMWNKRIGPAANARRGLPRITAEFFAQVRAALAEDSTPQQLHRVRLAAKRLRYTLELFRPCYGPALESRIESLRGMQQVLGDINDCAAAKRLLGNTVEPSRMRAKAQRFLAVRLRAKVAELHQFWLQGLGAPGQEALWTRYLARNSRPPRHPLSKAD